MTEIRLAANYSLELEDLLARKPDAVDAVKVSEFLRPEDMAAYGRVGGDKLLLLHGLAGDARPGNPSFEAAFRPEDLLAAIRLTGTSYLSVHLERVDAGELFCPRTFLDRLVAHVDRIRRVSGLPVLLENIHFYRSQPADRGNHPALCAPEFIAEALAATGCGLLLDLAHAQVVAWHRGESSEQYLDRLPLHLAEEIHSSGPVMVGGELRDRHEEIAPEGYDLLRRVLSRTNASTVTLEYGGVGSAFEGRSDPVVLDRQLTNLRRLIMRLQVLPRTTGRW
jgi:uncharacterized protein (UPF0276 family)